MNRFLITGNGVVKPTTVTEIVNNDLLEARVQILEDFSVADGNNLFSETANRTLSFHPTWVRISTDTHVLGRNGALKLVGNSYLSDCWQITSNGGNVTIVSSIDVDLQTVQDISDSLKILSTDGGNTYHISTQTGANIWDGEFITPVGGDLQFITSHTSISDLRSSNTWHINSVNFSNVHMLSVTLQNYIGNIGSSLSNITIKMVDDAGNTATGIPGGFTLSVESGDGVTTVGSTVFAFNPSTGEAILKNVAINGIEGQYRLKATYEEDVTVFGVSPPISISYENPFFFVPGLQPTTDSSTGKQYVDIRMRFDKVASERYIVFSSHNYGATVWENSEFFTTADVRYQQPTWRITYQGFGLGYDIANKDHADFQTASTSSLSRVYNTDNGNLAHAVEANKYFDIESVIDADTQIEYYYILSKQHTSNRYLSYTDAWTTTNSDGTGDNPIGDEVLDPITFKNKLVGANAKNQYIRFFSTTPPHSVYEPSSGITS